MSKKFEYYLKSYKLDREKDEEFFKLIDDIYFTDEVQGLKIYPQHADINRLTHITSVAYVSFCLAKEKGADLRQTVRGAVLHDLFYYDWHENDWSHRPHGYRHPGFALKNARQLTHLTPIEENIIYRHMFPLTPIPPKYKEGLIVSMADKYCATQELLIARNKKYAQKFKRALENL